MLMTGAEAVEAALLASMESSHERDRLITLD